MASSLMCNKKWFYFSKIQLLKISQKSGWWQNCRDFLIVKKKTVCFPPLEWEIFRCRPPPRTFWDDPRIEYSQETHKRDMRPCFVSKSFETNETGYFLSSICPITSSCFMSFMILTYEVLSLVQFKNFKQCYPLISFCCQIWTKHFIVLVCVVSLHSAPLTGTTYFTL